MTSPFDLLQINQPMCDWLTFTSWRKDGFSIFENTCWIPEESATEKRLNYEGKRYGSMFLGDGVQNGHWHRMLQVSGAAADDVLPLVLNDEENWECTQLDFQVTCDWYDHNLFDLCVELVRTHGNKKPQYIGSASGQTVYFGAWKSDKLIRIYTKSHRLVRLEVKFKKAYSGYMARTMIGLSEGERRNYIKAWLRWELDRLRSPMLDRVFSDSLSIEPLKPIREVNREESDRERWLRKVVLPTLHKYRNSHDHDPYLIAAFAEVIRGESDDNDQL